MKFTMNRVQLVYVDADPGEDAEEQIIMDLLIDDTTGCAVGPNPGLGFFGSAKSEIYPFLMYFNRPSGWVTMKYGNFDKDAYEERINIIARPIKTGDFFTYIVADGEESTYKVKKVTNLANPSK